ncbi:protein sax-3 [Patella vulgata]|uniref:protein sax-3 n=1 Tax=Patella vulgata TaxID=6465 RepID=UPI0024A901F4|nr:protein sax-3 [Patella vulgata]
MALLDCEFTGVPKPKIDWQHLKPDGHLVTLTEGVITADNSSILTVNNPTFLDSGLYTCIATNRYESQSTTGVLNVTAPPIILTPPKNQSVIKGIDLTLHCIVISDPLAYITWVFPDVSGHKPFNAFNNDDGSVTIKDVEQLNEGSYTCTATNRLGRVSASATLTVLEPVTATIAFPLQSLTNSRFVALDCRASGDPIPAIKWDKIGVTLDRTETRYIFLQNGDFIISSITKDTEEKDSGFYSCTADNNLSNATAYAIVYFDHGDVDCNTTFDNWNSGIGAAHGVVCPQGCLAMNNDDVYGSNPYSVNSPICSAALHNGVTDNALGGLVLWYVVDGRSSIFSSSTSNGISSLSSGPLFEGAMIVERDSGLYKSETTKVPVIG